MSKQQILIFIFVSITIFCIISIAVSNLFLSTKNYEEIIDIYEKQNLIKKLQNNKLNPNLTKKCKLLDKSQQYQIEIDGQIYPKSVPLFHNKSIDFKCLKESTNQTKLILLWTSFFNQKILYNKNKITSNNT